MENVNISKIEYLKLLRYKEVVRILEDVLHEPRFRQEFAKRIAEAEKRVKKGEKVTFRSIKEMSSYLDKMEQ